MVDWEKLKPDEKHFISHVLAFFAAYFVEMFNQSRLGIITAVNGANAIEQSGLPLPIVLGLIVHSLMYASQPAIMAEMFPTRMRYSGVSIGLPFALSG